MSLKKTIQAVVAVLLLLCMPPVLGEPLRVVSMTTCIDQLLLKWLPRHRIAALTWMASHPGMSAMSEQARGLPQHRADIESIIAAGPDLIIGSRFSAGNTLNTLAELGFRVLRVPYADSVATLKHTIQLVGESLGVGRQAAAHLAAIDTAEREAKHYIARHTAADELTAMVFAPNNYTVGQGTLEHDILTRLGVVNMAAHQGETGFYSITIEALLQRAPMALLTWDTQAQNFAQGNAGLDHPALATLPQLSASLPNPHSGCPEVYLPQLLHSYSRALIKNR